MNHQPATHSAMDEKYSIDQVREWLKQLSRDRYPIATTGRTTASICRPVIEMAVQKAGCILAYVKSVDPQRGRLILIAKEMHESFRPRCEHVDVLQTVDTGTSLTGLAVETKRIQYFQDVRKAYREHSFQDTALLAVLPPTASLLAIPILNIANPNQVLLVFTLYFDVGFALPEELKGLLQEHAKRLAYTVETNLRERTFRASLGVSQRLGGLDVLTDQAYAIFAESVRHSLQADQVTVYVHNEWAATAVTRRAESPAIVPTKGSVSRRGDPAPKLVCQVRDTNREMLANETEALGVEDEIFENDAHTLKGNVLLAPLHNISGQCKGVIRCVKAARNGGPTTHNLFTYDDLAIVEAMEQAFAAPLETLLAAEQRDVSLQKVAHELRVPTVAFGAVLERMEEECSEANFRFSHPHFREAWIYVDLMNRLVTELDMVRKGPSVMPIVLQETNIYTDVIIPAQRFLEPILRKRKFKRYQIRDSGFPTNLVLKLDAATITQVIFNLLENAIKYYPKNKAADTFSCTIVAKQRDRYIEIVISDNGPGIPREDRERIFEFGYRGNMAEESDVQGGGLGLWISRAVARRHNGNLVCRGEGETTQFVLSLPTPPNPRLFYQHIS
jgi:signal transduction histidine kinase